MAMLTLRKNMELLPAIGAVSVPDQAELLEDIECAVDGRWNGRRVPGPAALDQIRGGNVTVGFRQHSDHCAALRGPAQTALSQAITDGVPRTRQLLGGCHSGSVC